MQLLWEVAIMTDVCQLEPLRLHLSHYASLNLLVFSMLQKLFSVTLKLRFSWRLSLKAEFSNKPGVEPQHGAIPSPLSGHSRTRIILLIRTQHFISQSLFIHLKTRYCERTTYAERFLKHSFLTLKGTRMSQVDVEYKYVHSSLLRIQDHNFCHTNLLLTSSLSSQIADDKKLQFRQPFLPACWPSQYISNPSQTVWVPLQVTWCFCQYSPED